MKLSDLNSESIKQISNSELLSLHRRCHQLYQLAKKRNNIIMIKQIKKKHNLIVKEMNRREMKHTSVLESLATKIVVTPFRIKRIYEIMDELRDKRIKLMLLKQKFLESNNERAKMSIVKVNMQLKKIDDKLKKLKQELQTAQIQK
jgi:hypothetical protein